MPSKSQARRRLYTLLAVGKKELAWDENTYRSFLAAQGAKELKGKISASTLDYGSLFSAVEAMKKLGFKVKGSKNSMPAAKQKQISKITALWISLSETGAIRNPSPAAMHRWCARISGKHRLEWADTAALSNCIESLKALEKRHKDEQKATEAQAD